MVKVKLNKTTKKPKLNTIKKQEPTKTNKKLKTEKVKLILKDRLTTTELKCDLMDLNLAKVAIEGIFKLTTEKVKKKLFDEEYPIFLQVSCIKIPNCPDRILRLPLKSSLLTDTSEVCLIVADLKKGRRVDYNPTVEHYEDVLRTNKIDNIKRIIPVNSIKTEYDQFELKRKLVNQYDLFLADGKICGHLSHLLGKIFYEKRKLPNPVHMTRPDLKKSIQDGINKTQLHVHSKGNTFLTQIGNSKMSTDDILANLASVVEQLAKEFPGGWSNIRSLYVKSHLSIGIPIYMTLKSANEVKAPRKLGKRPKRFEDVTDELTTKTNSKITVSATGNVTVTQLVKKRNYVSLK